MPKTPGLRSSKSRFSRRSAFSFIEVLFAVILLGIGFIMIAGIFPVAIQQTGVVSNETQGTLITRDAIRKIQAIAAAPSGLPPAAAGLSNSLFQPTLNASGIPTVQSFSPNLLQELGLDTFYSVDRQFGWAAFYRRDSATSPFAQVFVVALQNQNFPNYTTAPMDPSIQASYTGPAAVPPAPPGVPAKTTVFLFPDSNTGLTTAAFPVIVANATSGTFMIVADSSTAAAGSAPLADFVGRILRLGTTAPIPFLPGNPTPYKSAFYLQPGYDLQIPQDPSQGITVFMLGRAPTLNAVTGAYTNTTTGPNQDIAAASAFISVNLSNN